MIDVVVDHGTFGIRERTVAKVLALGGLFAIVTLIDEPHDRVFLCIEDDEHWHLKQAFSAFWLDDLMKVSARAHLVYSVDRSVTPNPRVE